MLSEFYIFISGSRDSSVGITNSYGLDGRGLMPGNVQTGSGAHTVSSTVGTVGSFCGSAAPELEVNHSSPSGVKVKNGRTTPQFALPSSWHGKKKKVELSL
jgi:hypothetical protein